MEPKKWMIVCMAALLSSCTDQQLAESMEEAQTSEWTKEKDPVSAEILALVEKARWGDGQAFLRLADCYRDGIGVKKDFLSMMAMVQQAEARGAIGYDKEYLDQIPDDNDFKCFGDLMDKSSDQLREVKDSVMPLLAAMDSPDALAFYGVMCVESGDTIRGDELIREASMRGSDFAALLGTFADRRGDVKPDRVKLEQLSDRIPLVNKYLGRLCLKPDENGHTDERKAADYYLKADRHALLSRREARWLLIYHKRTGVPGLTDEDAMRLETLSGLPHELVEAVADTVSVDSIR